METLATIQNISGGTFLVKDQIGNVKELKVGDNLVQGDEITGLSLDGFAEVLLDGELVALNGTQSLVFDNSTNNSTFSAFGKDDMSFEQDSYWLEDNNTQVVEEDEITEEETASGEELIEEKESLGEFAQRANSQVNIEAKIPVTTDFGLLEREQMLDDLSMNSNRIVGNVFDRPNTNNNLSSNNDNNIDVRPTPPPSFEEDESPLPPVEVVATLSLAVNPDGTVGYIVNLDQPLVDDVIFNVEIDGEIKQISVLAGESSGSLNLFSYTSNIDITKFTNITDSTSPKTFVGDETSASIVDVVNSSEGQNISIDTKVENLESDDIKYTLYYDVDASSADFPVQAIAFGKDSKITTGNKDDEIYIDINSEGIRDIKGMVGTKINTGDGNDKLELIIKNKESSVASTFPGEGPFGSIIDTGDGNDNINFYTETGNGQSVTSFSGKLITGSGVDIIKMESLQKGDPEDNNSSTAIDQAKVYTGSGNDILELKATAESDDGVISDGYAIGNSNTVNLESGDDRVIISGKIQEDDFSKKNFSEIDGGTGIDTIELSGVQNIDFKGYLLSEIFKNIEQIELDEDRNVSISNLSVEDVLNMTDEKNTLIIRGDNFNSVSFITEDGNAWSKESNTETIDDIEYAVYKGSVGEENVTVKIEVAVIDSII